MKTRTWLCRGSFKSKSSHIYIMAACSAISDSLQPPWTVANQAPLSAGFSRQEYWSGLPFPPPRNLPDPGIKPASLASPAWAGGFYTAEPVGKPLCK